MSNLMLDVDQAGELKAAFQRGSWSNSQIKTLCEGDILARVRLVLEGAAEIVVKSVLRLVATVKVAATKGKKTVDCFTDKPRYYYRDSNLDNWLPIDQSPQPEGEFLVQQLVEPRTFKHVVENFLGVTGEIPALAKILRERGHVTTLETIESLVERQEAGGDVGLRTDGWANFFFVEEKVEEGKEPSVSVVYVYRREGLWVVSVYHLEYGYVWYDGYRFFFCNKTL